MMALSDRVGVGDSDSLCVKEQFKKKKIFGEQFSILQGSVLCWMPDYNSSVFPFCLLLSLLFSFYFLLACETLHAGSGV